MRKAFTVSQVNAYIRNMFRQDYLLHSIPVRGEVSNCKYHSSGHIYFTLKDASGTLSCVMFAGRRRGLSFHMQEGDQVVVLGSVDVYVRDGRYQLYAEQIIRDGVGALNERYELLKKKLEEEGMFDEQYKQPIPPYIRTLGVVTAPTGAAVQDIIHISLRRDPYLQIILFPAIVQGDQAPESIIQGIQALEQFGVDTMIIGRGGGSLEDLWAFNEERVAEAVFNCRTPIISAVGHETDTVITDYVADLRAPTPSAAAELAVFDYGRFVQDLEQFHSSFSLAMQHRLSSCREQANRYQRDLAHLSPEAQVKRLREQSSRFSEKLRMDMEDRIRSSRQFLLVEDRMRMRMDQRLDESRHRLQLLASQLDAHSPLRRLSGGYGYVTNEQGENLISVQQVKQGDSLEVTLKDGQIHAVADEVRMYEQGPDGNERADRTGGKCVSGHEAF